MEPDVRGAVTIREQLAAHREVAACNDCHAKIDPLGFPLEFYDPIGQRREHYGHYDIESLGKQQKRKKVVYTQGQVIDGSSILKSGERFQDDREFKQVLMTKKPMLNRALISKMLTYASGREMTYRDK